MAAVHRDALENPAFFRGILPNLGVERTVAFAPCAPPSDGDGSERDVRALEDRGFVRWPAVLGPSGARTLADAIDALVDAGLPPIFLYVYDEAWAVLPALLARAQPILGPTDVLVDLWAWRVPPGKRGWTPHRGSVVLERTGDGRPALLNAWIALRDVSPSEACIHLVPKGDDPFYPTELDRPPSEVPDDVLARAVALPTVAGEALAWDANVLHWGGESATTAEPRRSYSFTLRARRGEGSPEALPLEAMTFRDRLDAIATSIVTYAGIEDIAPSILRWARATSALRSLSRAGAGARSLSVFRQS